MAASDEFSAVIPDHMVEGAREFHYSPGLRAGNLLFVSGQIGEDENGVIADPEAQYVGAFESMKGVLEEASATFSDVVELVSYHTRFDDFDAFREIKDRFIPGPVYPAWTAAGVSELAFPELLVEIKAIAVLSQPGTR